MSGKLVIVPTPIGNLGDITLRARDALAASDVICAEDTRVTGKLLRALDISKPIERLDENMLGERAESVAQRVLNDETIAYCTDAGMPGVSDPGLRLVAAAREAGAEVEVLPGASAASTAYVASGTSNPHFYFGAFLPRKEKESRELLESLKSLDAALVFYESPNRLVNSLKVIANVFPTRNVSVCRELTKLHEEVFVGNAVIVTKEFTEREKDGRIKGEIVIVIDGPNPEEENLAEQSNIEAAKLKLEKLRAANEMSNKDLVRILQQEFNIPRNTAYDLVHL